jgi:hypothetical protein
MACSQQFVILYLLPAEPEVSSQCPSAPQSKIGLTAPLQLSTYNNQITSIYSQG